MQDSPKRTFNLKARVTLLVAGLGALAGCQSYGPQPATVSFVDLEQYAGLWYEIASNPVFFNEDLVNVTAEYTLRDDGKVGVLNKGFVKSANGEVDTIAGSARVVDTQTNSKLAVRFEPFFASLFEGKYWIVTLAEDYSHAVVTDERQMTLFVLSRTPTMSEELYTEIVADLAAIDIDTSRLRVSRTDLDW